MKLQIKLIGLLTGSGLFVATPTVAANLDLTTWEAFGDVQVVDSNLVNLSNNALLNDDSGIGVDEDYNFSNNPAIDNFFFDLEKELGLAPTTLDLDPNNFEYAYEGSALKTIVNVKAGEELTFDWNFFTNETARFPRPDYGFFLVNDTVFKLADFKDASAASTSTNYAQETGLQTYKYIFPNGGANTIAFGVVDIGDYDVSSALLVRNVTLTTPNQPETIPEPNSFIPLFCLVTFGISRLPHRSQN